MLTEVLQPHVIEEPMAEATAAIADARPDRKQRLAVLEEERTRLAGARQSHGDRRSRRRRAEPRDAAARKPGAARRTGRPTAPLRAELHAPHVTAGAVSATLRRRLAELRTILDTDRAGARQVPEAMFLNPCARDFERRVSK